MDAQADLAGAGLSELDVVDAQDVGVAEFVDAD